MSPTSPAGTVEPVIELNTTPLIDVMLVLIVMLVITIPPQTHSVRLDLPGKAPSRVINPVRNVLVVERTGMARWNGATVGDDALRATLTSLGAMENPPELHFRPDSEARYDRVDEVLAMTKRANVRKMGFVGNERYADF